MDSKEFAKKWKGAFARGVPKEVIAQYVDAEGCLLWHVFTWGKAPCLEREAADKAFDKADKAGAFIAKERAWKGGGCNIEYSYRGLSPRLKERRSCRRERGVRRRQKFSMDVRRHARNGLRARPLLCAKEERAVIFL